MWVLQKIENVSKYDLNKYTMTKGRKITNGVPHAIVVNVLDDFTLKIYTRAGKIGR